MSIADKLISKAMKEASDPQFPSPAEDGGFSKMIEEALISSGLMKYVNHVGNMRLQGSDEHGGGMRSKIEVRDRVPLKTIAKFVYSLPAPVAKFAEIFEAKNGSMIFFVDR